MRAPPAPNFSKFMWLVLPNAGHSRPGSYGSTATARTNDVCIILNLHSTLVFAYIQFMQIERFILSLYTIE